MDQEPIALRVYELIAEQYAARVDTKPHNAFYDRPATLSLLPPVAGLKVLDAGCGPGAYAEWLVDRGAEVIAIDVSPKMAGLASDRLKDRAKILNADFSKPLDFLGDGSMDIVLSALTMDYIRNWSSVFCEFNRVLRSGGLLVFSAGHPAAEFFEYHKDGNYFDVEQVSYVWRGFGTVVNMPYYRRPLGEMINPLIAAGFAIEHILEPKPVDEFKDYDPGHYEKLMRQPGFICFRARKD
ncbi:MAG: class I SAM-dependent methyltransferase [Blastocatellia bacterium]